MSDLSLSGFNQASPQIAEFSQSSLQTFLDCKKAFKLRYIEGMEWPSEQADPQIDYEKHLIDGNTFHKLLHQFFLGVPTEKIDAVVAASENSDLMHWWNNFITSVNLKQLDLTVYNQKHPEITLSLSFGQTKFIAKYDLIGINKEQIHIFDWKTNKSKPDASKFKQKIQTMVYLVVLAGSTFALRSSSDLPIPQITMTYWFANFPKETVSISCTPEILANAITRITDLVAEIRNEQEFLKTDHFKRCLGCVYRSYCDRGKNAGLAEDGMDDEFESEPFFSKDDLDFGT